MEKVCQIAIIGENIEWVIKGILLFKANKLILISTDDLKFKDKINDLKKRLLDKKFETNPIKIEEIIIEGQDPLIFVNSLKECIFKNFEQGYSIEINATAGLRVWQILGYFISIQLKKMIQKFFIINKQKGEALIFPLEILNKTEQLILDLISGQTKNIEEIRHSYEKFKGKKVTAGLISKYLTKLKEKKLINENKKERFKNFKLTTLGLIYSNNLRFYELD